MLGEKLLIKEIKEMTDKGYTDVQMAIELGCPPASIYYYRRKYNIVKDKSAKDKPKYEKIYKLYDEGLTIATIAKRLGYQYGYVKKAIEKRNKKGN